MIKLFDFVYYFVVTVVVYFKRVRIIKYARHSVYSWFINIKCIFRLLLVLIILMLYIIKNI